MAQTLSYQLQLAPKLDLQKKKWISAILTAAHDYRLVSAAEAAEAVDNSMSTLKQRTAQLNETLVTQKAKTAEAKVRTAAPIERLLSSRPASQPEHAACARPMHRLTAWGGACAATSASLSLRTLCRHAVRRRTRCAL